MMDVADPARGGREARGWMSKESFGSSFLFQVVPFKRMS